MPEYPKVRGEVKVHNKGRISVPKAVRTERGWADGQMLRWVEAGPGTLIVESAKKTTATGFRAFQA